jgi:hypothetical protein
MLNFPSSPTEGQAANGFVYRSSVWRRPRTKTALPKNYLINPTFQISQQNGAVSQTVSGSYPVDQWPVAVGGMAAASMVSYQEAAASPMGDFYRLVLRNSVAYPTLAASDYALVYQVVEGQRFDDMGWGTTAAKPAVFRAEIHLSQPGQIAIAFRDHGTYAASYVVPVVYSAASWQHIEVAIPPPPVGAGTWLTTEAGALNLTISHDAGTTYRTTPNQWVTGTGGAFAHTGMTNNSAAVTYLTIADVGFYADPDGTGKAPPWEPPDFIRELRRCQRYWYKGFTFRGGLGNATTTGRMAVRHPVPMRANPAAAIVGSPRIYDGTATPIVTSLPGNSSNKYVAELTFTAAAGGLVGGRGCSNYYVSGADYFAMSARF